MKKIRLLRQSMLAGISVILLSSNLVMASPTLRQGSTGHDVMLLQKKLSSVGYNINSIDGIYGTETEQAVADFQRDQKIRITGIVNNATWRALQNSKKRPWGSSIKKPATNNNSSITQKLPLAPNNQPILTRSKVNSLLQTARSYLGTPYQFGGSTPKAFDCSGYLQYIFAQNGIAIPRTADEQYKLGQRTYSSNQLEPGDLVFFTTYEPGASHCGLYLGGGEFIHASSSGVRVDKLSNSYWAPKYYGGKHIVK